LAKPPIFDFPIVDAAPPTPSTKAQFRKPFWSFAVLTMVKVWYEPPPGGPRTNLNSGAYYSETAMTPNIIKRLSRAPAAPIIMGFIAVTGFLCYIPLSKYLLIGSFLRVQRFLDRCLP
jgi:hypothetical protein